MRVKPFGRLLASYTVNEIGDAVGIVALAILVYDRTQEVVPDRRVLHGGQVPPGVPGPAC